MSTCKAAIQSGLEEDLQALKRAIEGLTPTGIRWQAPHQRAKSPRVWKSSSTASSKYVHNRASNRPYVLVANALHGRGNKLLTYMKMVVSTLPRPYE